MMRYKFWLGVGASVILGLIFAVAGAGKLLGQTADFKLFFTSFTGFLTPALTEAFFNWLPWLELVIGLMLITGIAAKFVATFSSLLIAGFITNNVWLLNQGLGYVACGCFGLAESIIPGRLSTTGSLYLDTGMLALVFIVLFFYKGSLFNFYPWFLRRGKIAEKKDWPGSG